MTSEIESLIRKRAYDIWQHRQKFNQFIRIDRLGNEIPYTAEDDWLFAEKQVLQGLEHEV